MGAPAKDNGLKPKLPASGTDHPPRSVQQADIRPQAAALPGSVSLNWRPV